MRCTIRIYALYTALGKARVETNINAVAYLSRGRSRSTVQLCLPTNRQTRIRILTAPQITALTGKVQVIVIEHDSRTNIADIRCAIRSRCQIQRTTLCIEACNRTPIQSTVVTTEVNSLAVSCRASPIEAVAAGRELLHGVIRYVDLIVSACLRAARPCGVLI